MIEDLLTVKAASIERCDRHASEEYRRKLATSAAAYPLQKATTPTSAAPVRRRRI